MLGSLSEHDYLIIWTIKEVKHIERAYNIEFEIQPNCNDI